MKYALLCLTIGCLTAVCAQDIAPATSKTVAPAARAVASGDAKPAKILAPEAALSDPLPFIGVPPCRVVDTRTGQGKTPPFGPPVMAGNTTRSIPIPQSTCGIPATAKAYSLNVTVVPSGPLQFLSIWPTGQTRPGVSTLNSFDGKVVANAAVVPAGTDGSIDVYVTNETHVIIDINGYFGAGALTSLPFYPVAPCRVMDTRTGEGKTFPFGPPTPGPATTREVPIPQSTCNIPSNAKGYSLNITIVPQGPLSYLTVWPTGQLQPLVSTLNSFEGKVVANAAIVPAGSNGSINIFVTDATNVIVDINGYFAE
jgi:hypothetical protein